MGVNLEFAGSGRCLLTFFSSWLFFDAYINSIALFHRDSCPFSCTNLVKVNKFIYNMYMCDTLRYNSTISFLISQSAS